MLLHKHVPISHYEFQKGIAFAWIGGETHWPKHSDDRKHIDHRRSFANATTAITTSTEPSIIASTRRSRHTFKRKNQMKQHKLQ